MGLILTQHVSSCRCRVWRRDEPAPAAWTLRYRLSPLRTTATATTHNLIHPSCSHSASVSLPDSCKSLDQRLQRFFIEPLEFCDYKIRKEKKIKSNEKVNLLERLQMNRNEPPPRWSAGLLLQLRPDDPDEQNKQPSDYSHEKKISVTQTFDV